MSSRFREILPFLRLAWPGLLLIAVDAVRSAPPAFLLPGGYPHFGYYPYSFLHWNYSDVVALYGSRQLYLHLLPYFHNVIEYPVLIGLYMSGAALWPGFGGYYAASVLGLMAGFTVALYALWRGRGVEAARWFTWSPMLLVFGVLNWDLLGIAGWGLAVWCFVRRRYGWAGFWAGIGVVTKFFPIVLVPYMAAYLYREHKAGRDGGLGRFLAGFAVTGIGINLPFMVFAERGWSEFFTYNSGRGPDPGVYQWLWQQGVVSISAVNALSLGVTVAGGLWLLAEVLRGRLDPVAAGAAGLTWWIVCNKVYSPQYMLWVYYAMLWLDTGALRRVAMNVAGVLDFGLAMRWLALGTTKNPGLIGFVDWVVPTVLSVRYLTLLWVFVVPAARALSADKVYKAADSG